MAEFESIEEEPKRGCCTQRRSSSKFWQITKSELKDEVKQIGLLAGPVIITYILTMLMYNINLFFVGRLGENELAAASLAFMYANVTGNSIIIGLMSAMETLISQANGAKNYRRVGIILQRSILIVGTLCIPVAIAWMFCEQILLLLQQDPIISKLSGQYVRIYALGIPAYVVFEAVKRYLQMQGMMGPPIVAVIFANLINPVLQYLCIYVLKWRFTGAAFAAIALLGWMKWKKLHEKTWFGWSRESFRGWGEYMKLGLPGALMVMLEWGSFEIVAIGIGLLHNSEILAAHAVIANTVAFCFMVPLGISIAVSTRVGNFLGAGQPDAARKSSLICMMITVLEKYGQDSITFDGTQGSLGGVLRGCGKQKWGAIVNLCAFYLIGIPFAFVSTLKLNLGLYGTWIGLSMAEALIAISYAIITITSNWNALSKHAQETAKGEFQPVSTELEETGNLVSDKIKVIEQEEENESTNLETNENHFSIDETT